jgi:hypothetical protein
MSRKFKIRDQEAAHSSAGNYAKLSENLMEVMLI